MEQLQRV